MDWNVATYAAYLLVALPLTLGVARTLARHGRAFLDDVFVGDPDLADAVNRLLVVGFYLLNLGFVSLYLRSDVEVRDLGGLLEQLSVKVGVVSVVIGIVHFLNVWVFTTMRRRHRLDQQRAGTPAPGYAPPYAPPFPVHGR